MDSRALSVADASLEVWRRGNCKEVTAVTPVSGEEWARIPDGDLDSILVRGEAIERWGRDPVTALCEWRRTLKREGALAVVIPTTAGSATIAPEVLVTLVDLVGGFLHGEVKTVDASHSLFVGIRSTVAEIRMPLSVHGPLFAKAADQPKARGELYFQIATILLQAHDYELASACYRKLKDLEPQSSEALFGLGMCEVCRGELESGIEFLKAAKVVDPQNAEIQKWIDLAGLAGRAAERAAKKVTTTLRGGPVLKPMPKPAPLPSAAPAVPERAVRARS